MTCPFPLSQFLDGFWYLCLLLYISYPFQCSQPRLYHHHWLYYSSILTWSITFTSSFTSTPTFLQTHWDLQPFALPSCQYSFFHILTLIYSHAHSLSFFFPLISILSREFSSSFQLPAFLFSLFTTDDHASYFLEKMRIIWRKCPFLSQIYQPACVSVPVLCLLSAVKRLCFAKTIISSFFLDFIPFYPVKDLIALVVLCGILQLDHAQQH